ncbi:MAG: hypothetical protein LBO62_00920 [Endomicrobium sp.]|jgi:hypothetical protein|nr:hypothetical protein [Endomicrobium sp.]
MKKVFTSFALILFISSSSFAEISLAPKFSIDIPASLEYDVQPDAEDAKRGYDISVELRGTISKWFMWGAGASYMFDRGIAGYGSEKDFSFLPLYASLMFTPFSDFKLAKPYVRGNIGYDIAASNKDGKNMKGGIYYGGALGVEYKDFIAEVYGGHHLAVYDNPGEVNIKYVQIGLSLGYKFILKEY